MTFDVEEFNKITRQIIRDIPRVWYMRKLLKARNLYEEGKSVEEIAVLFDVKTKTAEGYIKKSTSMLLSEDKLTQYKLSVALVEPDRDPCSVSLDIIRSYVIRNRLHKENWFFKTARKN
ncbi:hypothetical protein [Pantoea ananatis]|uniref:hypothetical protein n=1 Tax=Pantoea ananas TaxID=553 RepID=UPI001F4F09ED|nr:hypothetical protein [Pantoea ananatis]MCH9271870.1 hypothetical protein [Pantoea ananatis]